MPPKAKRSSSNGFATKSTGLRENSPFRTDSPKDRPPACRFPREGTDILYSDSLQPDRQRWSYAPSLPQHEDLKKGCADSGCTRFVLRPRDPMMPVIKAGARCTDGLGAN